MGTTPTVDIDDVPHVADAWDELVRDLGARRPAVFVDFDGTLAPIVDHPADARITDDAASSLRRLARDTFVAVVSGRDLPDLQRRVGVDGIWYAGSHGFDIAGPGGEQHRVDAADDALPALDAAEAEVAELVERIPGAELDRKRYSVATHYRHVAADRVDEVRDATADIAVRHGLRWSDGRKVVEIQPDVDWHKGRALQFLLRRLDLDEREVIPVFIGDSSTDEDAFEVLADRGIGVVVRNDERAAPDTAAGYAVDGPDDVPGLLDRLATRITGSAG